MAKLKKPFGRQIASLKTKAIEQAGEGANHEKQAEAANKIAKDEGFDYIFTADSFKPKKASKPRKARKEKEETTANGFPQQAARAVVKDFLKDWNRLVEDYGIENVKELAKSL